MTIRPQRTSVTNKADRNTKEKWNVIQKYKSHVERGKTVQRTDIGP